MNYKIITALTAFLVIWSPFYLPGSRGMFQTVSLNSANMQSAESKTAKKSEYEVKAAFIYNFLKFVEWPESESKSDNESNKLPTISIGVLGVNPFGTAFQPILYKKVNGQKITIYKIESFKEFNKDFADKENTLDAYRSQHQKTIRNCQVIFFCKSEKHYVKDLLDLTSRKAILTISDIPEFAEKGGVIAFIKDKDKIRFEINLEAANKKKLKIRSQLLTLAKNIYEDNYIHINKP